MLTRIDTSAWSDRRSIALWRLDLMTCSAVGNKHFKLLGNLQAMRGRCVMTFGGAFSNHLYAFAHLARHYQIQPVAVVRGEAQSDNEVLRAAAAMGMRLHPVSRADYRRRHEPSYCAELADRLGADCVLPEGGSNIDAVIGCKQITAAVNAATDRPRVIVLAVGTGATFAGVTAGAKSGQQVVGVRVVKDPEIPARAAHWQRLAGVGGQGTLIDANTRYANPDDDTVRFILQVFAQTGIVLDPVYNGPALFRVLREETEVGLASPDPVFIHTGGLTGAWGMRERFRRLAQGRLVTDYYAQIKAQTATAGGMISVG